MFFIRLLIMTVRGDYISVITCGMGELASDSKLTTTTLVVLANDRDRQGCAHHQAYQESCAKKGQFLRSLSGQTEVSQHQGNFD